MGLTLPAISVKFYVNAWSYNSSKSRKSSNVHITKKKITYNVYITKIVLSPNWLLGPIQTRLGPVQNVEHKLVMSAGGMNKPDSVKSTTRYVNVPYVAHSDSVHNLMQIWLGLSDFEVISWEQLATSCKVRPKQEWHHGRERGESKECMFLDIRK